jgi:pyruvate,water dikinase
LQDHQAKGVLDVLAKNGLRGEDGLMICCMFDIPANALAIEDFAQFFDGFFIDSNDLTQLTLGVDRDSGDLANVFDEENPAVKKAVEMAIDGAHRNGCLVGLCGQAPSDKPEFAPFLVEQ